MMRWIRLWWRIRLGTYFTFPSFLFVHSQVGKGESSGEGLGGREGGQHSQLLDFLFDISRTENQMPPTRSMSQNSSLPLTRGKEGDKKNVYRKMNNKAKGKQQTRKGKREKKKKEKRKKKKTPDFYDTLF